MSKNLEDFISDNRSAFDDKAPSGKVWENINAAVTGKKEKKIIWMAIIKWSVAAAAVVVIATVVYLKLNKTQPTEPVLVKTETDINTLAPEYATQVNEFAKLIGMKQEELKVLAKEQPQLYQKFTTDIIQLDSSYNALKSQLAVSPNKEMLIEAMIQNLQLQLNVLNQQLNIIKQIKQSKEYSHETSYQKI